ncbi:hypothetical protein MHBO_000468 [Bonamia ostreae]|uniref:Mif2/CENP-C cupin domain-containing protein n=1 Tax=Bonamia ostreae TaxID=126728 RepID=A0ABV2AGA4_9EUKA
MSDLHANTSTIFKQSLNRITNFLNSSQNEFLGSEEELLDLNKSGLSEDNEEKEVDFLDGLLYSNEEEDSVNAEVETDDKENSSLIYDNDIIFPPLLSREIKIAEKPKLANAKLSTPLSNQKNSFEESSSSPDYVRTRESNRVKDYKKLKTNLYATAKAPEKIDILPNDKTAQIKEKLDELGEEINKIEKEHTAKKHKSKAPAKKSRGRPRKSKRLLPPKNQISSTKKPEDVNIRKGTEELKRTPKAKTRKAVNIGIVSPILSLKTFKSRHFKDSIKKSSENKLDEEDPNFNDEAFDMNEGDLDVQIKPKKSLKERIEITSEENRTSKPKNRTKKNKRIQSKIVTMDETESAAMSGKRRSIRNKRSPLKWWIGEKVKWTKGENGLPVANGYVIFNERNKIKKTEKQSVVPGKHKIVGKKVTKVASRKNGPKKHLPEKIVIGNKDDGDFGETDIVENVNPDNDSVPSKAKRPRAKTKSAKSLKKRLGRKRRAITFESSVRLKRKKIAPKLIAPVKKVLKKKTGKNKTKQFIASDKHRKAKKFPNKRRSEKKKLKKSAIKGDSDIGGYNVAKSTFQDDNFDNFGETEEPIVEKKGSLKERLMKKIERKKKKERSTKASKSPKSEATIVFDDSTMVKDQLNTVEKPIQVLVENRSGNLVPKSATVAKSFASVKLKKIAQGEGKHVFATKALSFDQFSFGFLVIPPKSLKQLEKPLFNQMFFVHGAGERGIKVLINGSSLALFKGSCFLAPKQNSYSIENFSGEVAKLCFWITKE